MQSSPSFFFYPFGSIKIKSLFFISPLFSQQAVHTFIYDELELRMVWPCRNRQECLFKQNVLLFAISFDLDWNNDGSIFFSSTVNTFMSIFFGLAVYTPCQNSANNAAYWLKTCCFRAISCNESI